MTTAEPVASRQDPAARARKIGDVPFLAPLNNACVTVARDPGDGREVLFASFYSGEPEAGCAGARVTPVWWAANKPWGGALAASGRKLLLSIGNELYVLDPA